MDHLSWCDFIAGWVGGVCGLLIGHPMDTVKVRQQIFYPSGSFEIVVKTFQYEGIHGFYKGMTFPLVTSGALNAIFFGLYGNMLRSLEIYHKRHDPENTEPSPHYYKNIFFAGLGAGIVQVIATNPIDLVKIQLQSQTGTWEEKHSKQHIGPVRSLIEIYKAHGLRGWYHGLTSMMYRDSISSGVYVLTYVALLDALHGPEHLWTVLFAGGTSGVISWVVILPIDVIKTRIQADDIANPEYKSFRDCAIKSYKADGLKVFFRGFSMSTVRSFPVNSAVFLGYEWTIQFCASITGEPVYFQKK